MKTKNAAFAALAAAILLGCATAGSEAGIEGEEAPRRRLSFSEANPGYLQGAWLCSKDTPPHDVELTFLDGEQFAATAAAGKTRPGVVSEGIYFFNQNAILLYYIKVNGKDSFLKEVIFYEMRDGTLLITGWTDGGVNGAAGLRGKYGRR